VKRSTGVALFVILLVIVVGLVVLYNIGMLGNAAVP